jgi:hypothetical protein
MKRKTTSLFLAALAVSLFVVTGFAQDGPFESQWAATPVQIDGLDLDWQGTAFMVDKNSKAEYAFKNDGQNLYILFVFKDSVSKSTIDAMGMTVYYNLEGKKKKAEGLHFIRKTISPDELIASLEAKGEDVSEERKAEIRKQPGYILFEGEVLGVKRKSSADADTVPVDPPTFRASQAPPPKSQPQQGQPQRGGGISMYEYRIPLARNPVIGGIGTEPGKSLKLFFEWGGMTKEMMAVAMTRTAEGSTGARSGSMSTEQALSGGSDNLDTAREGMGGLRRNDRAKKHSFWIDVKLAGQGQ